jgi:hypothetical protein
MTAPSNKTDEDISNVPDKQDESDVFSEESHEFLFDTSEEDSDSESYRSNVVHELNRMKNCYVFRILLYLTAWRFQDLHFSV